ncbi:DUF2066 domain-containing protein [Marinicella litoralis]|uniref:Uncharacterized protein DUF2066 n=1 Tax=Marinicella litoralis TaxID=644220 RepID=A0A4R6XEU9_9GAMM|nr:DUF2066 domain-containing protein [Marinicella litoralis]TDR16270.1 uncharacterized protein DUF2066 [Marinicella litoralis]
MRNLCLFLLMVTYHLNAANVVTNQAAALIDTNQMPAIEQSQHAMASVISKKSGLSLKSVLNKGLSYDDFSSAIMRSYFQQPPIEYNSNKMWFSVVVDEEKLKSMMLAQRIPVWPDRRGELFVWIVEEHENQDLINTAPNSETFYWLQQWFEQKGIPASFYNYQNDDLLDFQPRDVRYLNPDLIDFVEENYDAAVSLFVFVKHSGNGYSYRYGLSRPGKSLEIKNLKFVSLAAGMEALATDIQAKMSDGQQVFADEFNKSTVSVKVNNIENADQILSLITYFDNHALIDKYHINQLSNGQVAVMMDINVLPDTFVKFVSREQVINHLPLDLGHSIIFSMSE